MYGVHHMPQQNSLPIGQAAVVIGVAVSTLRRRDKENSFSPDCRTVGGHRRYHIDSIKKRFFSQSTSKEHRKTILYARVSGHDQKKDLETQSKALEDFALKQNFDYFELIKDLGPGLNCKKKGLKKLVDKIIRGEVERIILTHRDRLLRFGMDLLFQICAYHNTEIYILNDETTNDFNAKLVSEIIEIVTVSAARLYGKRSHQNRRKAA